MNRCDCYYDKMQRKFFLIILFIFICTGSAFSFSAVSDSVLKKGRISESKLNFDTIYASDIFEIDKLELPKNYGVSVLSLSSRSFNEPPSYIWKSSEDLVSSDKAIVLKEKINFPSEGKVTFKRSLELSNGVYSSIEWQYRVLSADYARITRRVNNGSGINVYDGEPLSSADFTSVFLIDKLISFSSADSELTLHSDGTDDFKDLKINLNNAFLNADSIVLSDISVGQNQNILDVSKNSLSDKVSNLSWRITVLPLKGTEIFDTIYGSSNSNFVSWDGMLYSKKVPVQPGNYRLRVNVSADFPKGRRELMPFELNVKVLKYPRITVFNSLGELISDSRFSGVLLPKNFHNEKLCKPYSFSKIEQAYNFGLNRIYMKPSEDETFSIKVVADASTEKAYVSSAIRNTILLPLNKSSEGEYTGKIKVTSKQNSSKDVIAVGGRNMKSFSFLETTYPEDSETFSAILKEKGYVCTGAISPEKLNIPDAPQFLLDFMRCAGFEDLSFSFDSAGKRTSSHLFIKNQAQVFYYSGHGWGDGSIYTGYAHFHPDNGFKPGDWGDGLSMVIFSSCSVLDIMNVHNRKFTHIGNFTLCPGEYWAKALGPEGYLLGYNWSTFEGKPPNAFDTRVIKSFLSRLGKEDTINAWMNANYSNKEPLAACVIYNYNYYYMNGSGGTSVLPQSRWSNKI